MKTAVALLALAGVAVACGEGPPGSAPTTTTTARPSSTSSVADSTTTEAPPAETEKVDEILEALAALDSYRFEVRYGDAVEVQFAGHYDGSLDAISYSIEVPEQGRHEVMRVGERIFMRGLLATTFEPDANTDEWLEALNYEADPLVDGELAPHLIPATIVEISDREDVADGSWTVGEEEIQRLADEQQAILGLEDPTWAVSLSREDGAFVYRVEGSGGDFSLVIEPAEVHLQAPEHVAVIDLLAPPRPEPTSIEPDEDGVLFQAGRYLGPVDLRLSVEANGRVVQVTDTSVFATTSDYRSWRLDEEAVEMLTTAIEESGLLDHPEANRQFGEAEGEGYSIYYNSGRIIDLHGPETAPGLTESQRQRRRIFFDLFHRLTDQGWLEGHFVETPAPFVPESLSLTLEPSFDEPNTDWPFDAPASDLESEPGLICLAGDDVAPLWEALGDTPFRRVVAFDGDETWSVLVQPHTPGYRLSSDPCPDG